MFNIFGMAALLVISSFALYKVWRIHLQTFQILAELRRLPTKHLIDVTQQLQAMETLKAELDLPQLPVTRGWSASPDFLCLLAEHVRLAKPMTVVECSSGSSTVVLARALQLAGGGHVYSLEHDPAFAERTRGLLNKFGLSDWATIIDAPLRPYELRSETWPWYQLDHLTHHSIDMLIIDGPPMPIRQHSRYPAGPILFGRLSSNASIFLDDADREEERAIVSWWQQDFPLATVKRHSCEKGCAEITFSRAS